MDGGGPSVHNTLFIDTSLDTHFALLVSDHDTVSDLKRKILSEHPLCFPTFGEIKINALMVKRRERFYHLTDHLFVKTVFHGVQNDWFLFVDASGVTNHDTPPDGTSNKMFIDDDSKLQGFGPYDSIREVLKDLETQVKHVSGDRCKISSSDSSEKIQKKCKLISEGNEMPIKYNKESSSNVVISDLQCHFPLKEDTQNGALSKIKNKKKRKFDPPVESSAIKVNIGSFNDMIMGNKHITDEPERDDNGLKEMVVDVPANTPAGESPDARTGTKKRRKINKKSEDLLFNSLSKEKTTTTTENKSKSKPSYSNNDAAVAVSSCLEDIREENTKAISEGRRDFGNVPDEAIIDEKIVEDGDSVIVQEAVTVPEVLSHGVLIDIGSNEAEPANTGKENESVDPKVMLQEKRMKEVVDVPANIPVGKSPDACTTTKRRKINKKSEDLICDSSNKDKKTKKSKQKPSYSNNDGAVAVPSCLDDTREESTKAILEGGQNFGEEPDEAIIHEKVVEDASLRENHSVTVQEAMTVPEVLSHGTNEIEAAKTMEINEWLRENDPKVMPEEKSVKEVVDPSILLLEEGNRVAEQRKLSGREKRVKKTKNTKGKVQLSLEMEYSVASGKTSTELLKAVHENVEKSVQPMHVDKPVEISKNQDVKGRKKSKKKISSGLESFSDVQMKEQDAGHSIEKTREARVLSKKTMKPDLVETSSENLNTKGKVQSSEMEYSVSSGKTSTELLKAVHENAEKSVQPIHDDKPVKILKKQDVKGRKKISSGVESFSDVQMEKQDVDHSIEITKVPHVLSKKIRKPDLVETSSENLNNSILQFDTLNKSLSLQFEAVVDEDSTNGFADETNKKIVDSTTSHGDGDVIKASDNFVPSQSLQKVQDSTVAFYNKVIESRIAVRRVEAKKNSEESGVGNSSTIQGSLRENYKSDKLMPCLQKGSSKVSENKKAAQRSASRPKIVKVSTTPASSRLNVNEIDKDAGALTSSSEISSHKNKSVVGLKRMAARNISAQRSMKRKVPDVKSVQQNISKRGKSLLAISSTVFKNDKGHSSEEDGLVDSDVSTRTPSDNFSSSDDSEVENVAGSQDARMNVNENNDLESILKNSSRFKKAMITASQTPVEDMDGLPVELEYVPYSQPKI